MEDHQLFLTLVIPGFNEGENIDLVASEALRALEGVPIPSYELLLVNDGSSDNTLQVMEAVRARNSHVRVVSHEINKGLGAAIRTGFEQARGEWVLWIPGDGQFSPTDTLKAVSLLAENDLVIFVRQGRKDPIRSLISRGYYGLTELLYGFDATDMCGMYYLRRKLFHSFQPVSQDIFLNMEIILRARRTRQRIALSNIEIKPRLAGSSKVANFRTIAKNLYEMLRFRFRW